MTKKTGGGGSLKNGGGVAIESPVTAVDRVPPTSPVEIAKKISDQLKEAQAMELNQRLVDLNKELTPLLIAHGFGLSGEAYLDQGIIKARSIVVDTRL